MKKEKTILTFIMTVRHPDNSHDYNRVWNLLKNTLRSVCAQTNKNFKIVVVANKILDDFKNDPQIKNLEFVKVDFKAPGPKGVVRTGMDAVRLDKSTKYVRGLIHAKKYNSKYTMLMDADDFLSNKLVEHISNNDPLCFNSGWIIKDGFVTNLKKIKPRSERKSFCGSNIIFNTKLIESEINFNILNNSSTQDEIKKSSNDFYLSKVIGSHLFSIGYFEKTKPRFLEIPFRGTIYNVGTGENHQNYDQEEVYFSKGQGEDITNDIIEEFKLPLKTKLPGGHGNTYNLGDKVRLRKANGLDFEGSIAQEYLRKVGPPYDLTVGSAVDTDFKLLQDIVKDRAPKNIDQDAFAIHIRAFDCLAHLKRQDFAKNLVALIKKYNLNRRFKKCLIFYGDHMSFINRGKTNKAVVKSNNYAKELKKEIESLGLNCQLSEQVEDGEKDPKIRSTRTDEDFIAMATAKCFVVGHRGFSWLAASINPNEVIWDLQDPPNFPWIVNKKDYLDPVIKGYEFQIKNKS